MNRYISLLRGINVGGKRKILMKDLKMLYEQLEFSNVISYIQSGNVIFDTERTNKKEIAQQIKLAIYETFGFDVPVIIRSNLELQQVIFLNPFLKTHNPDISKLCLSFLAETPSEVYIKNLMDNESIENQEDEFEIIDDNVFIRCMGKYHESKLTNNLFEKMLKISVTTRNWKTVMKLIEMTF